MPADKVQKATSFDPTADYVTDGQYVWQNGIKYPVSVLQDQINQWFDPQNPDIYLQSFISDMTKAGWSLASIAFASLLLMNTTDYISAAQLGQDSAISRIRAGFPNETIKPSIQDTAVFDARVNALASQMSQSMKNSIDNIIENGIKTGATYGQLHDSILQTLGIDPNGPTNIGYRAERVAHNEAMFAVRTGMLQEYSNQSIQYVDLINMEGACQICIDAASDNPYTVEEAIAFASGLHVNCACILEPAQENFAQNFEESNENDIMKILNL